MGVESSQLFKCKLRTLVFNFLLGLSTNHLQSPMEMRAASPEKKNTMKC